MTKRYFTVRKSVEFDAGHRVPNHASKCCNVHGHRYKVEVEVEGELVPEGCADPSEGMVLDFGDVKKALMEEIHDVFDHCFIMWDKDKELDDLLSKGTGEFSIGDPRKMSVFGIRYRVDGFGWVQEIPCVPTAENLAYLFYECLSKRLDNERCSVFTVRVHETPTSVAEYARPNETVLAVDSMGYVGT